jgi:large subunit ribosomal protein L6
MSKIGRKGISLESVEVSINQNIISYKGKENSGKYSLPELFKVYVENNLLYLELLPEFKNNKKAPALWGLHRALINNAISGARKLFEKQIKIEGLGYKADLEKNNITFSLGFSHKINYEIPKNVHVEIDKSKQNITVKSFHKDLLGDVCAKIKSFKPVEPYKGKGIYYVGEKIMRKEGKTK